MSFRDLITNKKSLDYKEITTAIIGEFNIKKKINWDAVVPEQNQHNIFGGELLRLIEDHPNFRKQKDIRALARLDDSTSQMLLFFARLKDKNLSKSTIERITKGFVRGNDAQRYILWFFGNSDNTVFKVVLAAKTDKKLVLKSLPFGINQPYYKTYDVILSEVRKQLSPLFTTPEQIWNTLWKAFDISVVNKSFYNDIKKAFDSLIDDDWLKGAIRQEEERKQFAVRLIGRIIFS